MTNRPTASIVIDNYNYDQFLGEAIESALSQTWPEVEVIVVDDGSTDSSSQVIASFGNRISSILKSNGGQASAFNAGFATSQGEVIYFLDSDDVYLPDTVERSIQAFADPVVSRVQWPMLVIEQGSLTSRQIPKQKLAEGNLKESTLLRGPASHNSSPTSGNAWSRWFLEQVIPIPETQFRLHADAFLFSASAVCGEIRASELPLSIYRVHGGNYTLSQDASRLLALWEVRASALQQWLESKGIEVDPDLWRANNRYRRKLMKAAEDAVFADQPAIRADSVTP